MINTNFKILIVDDKQEILSLLKRYITSVLPELSIETASNGRVALEKLVQMSKNEKLPDLVLSDVMMPNMDGLELYKSSKKEYPNLMFILMSGYNSNEEEIKRLKIPYLEKPFKLEEVKNKIVEVLNYEN